MLFRCTIELSVSSEYRAEVTYGGNPGTNGMFLNFFDEWKLVNVPSVLSFPIRHENPILYACLLRLLGCPPR